MMSQEAFRQVDIQDVQGYLKWAREHLASALKAAQDLGVREAGWTYIAAADLLLVDAQKEVTRHANQSG